MFDQPFLSIHSCLNNEGKMYGHLKTDVADAVVCPIEPIQQPAINTTLRDDQRQKLD